MAYPMPAAPVAMPGGAGVVFSVGIPMVFTAVQRQVDPLAWALVIGNNLFWVLAYDTEYAMVDRDDDLKIGIRTSAITLGRADGPRSCCSTAVSGDLVLGPRCRSA